MEVYTPIPDVMLPRPPRAFRGAGRLVLVIALVVVASAVVRATFVGAPRPRFHNYGVEYTSVGTAAVACGGEVSDGCGVDTAIRFEECSTAVHDYFDAATGPAGIDQLVRRLIRKRPPSGDTWIMECGGADGLIEGQPLAHLESD